MEDKTEKLVKEIIKETQIYKRDAELLAQLLHNIEVHRTRIINQIEEAVYNGLEKRTAGRLEDKLTRPYGMILFKTNK